MSSTETTARGPLTAIAIFKLLKAALLLAVATGALGLLHRDVQAQVLNLLHVAHVNPGHQWVQTLVAKLTGLGPTKIEVISIGLMAYAVLFAVEGIALLMRRRWAEYLTVISTGLLLPPEIWEVYRRPHAVRVLVLIANGLIVIYLAVRLRRSRHGGAAS